MNHVHTIVTLEWQVFQHLRDFGHENPLFHPLMHYGRRQIHPVHYGFHVWLHKVFLGLSKSQQSFRQIGPMDVCVCVRERERERERDGKRTCRCAPKAAAYSSL